MARLDFELDHADGVTTARLMSEASRVWSGRTGGCRSSHPSWE
jgi:hypothetical protein